MENAFDFKLTELEAKECVIINGGFVPTYIWQAAVGTFVYNVVADWEENVAAFKRGMELAE